jgi:hypothetical protein
LFVIQLLAHPEPIEQQWSNIMSTNAKPGKDHNTTTQTNAFIFEGTLERFGTAPGKRDFKAVSARAFERTEGTGIHGDDSYSVHDGMSVLLVLTSVNPASGEYPIPGQPEPGTTYVAEARFTDKGAEIDFFATTGKLNLEFSQEGNVKFFRGTFNFTTNVNYGHSYKLDIRFELQYSPFAA